MIYGFLFYSSQLLCSHSCCFYLISVHFVRSSFLSSHLSAWSDPLLLLELWDTRLDTPLSYELNSLINPAADLSK